MRLDKEIQYPIFKVIAETAELIDVPAYVIGGYVRDLIMKRPSHDIDIVVLGSGIDMARKVAETLGKKTKVSYYKNFGTAMLRYKGQENWIVEFVGARKESYKRNSSCFMPD